MSVTHATDADFRTILDSNENVIVKYYADWCGSCKLFAPKFRRLSTDERFTNVTFIEVNAETDPEARKTAGVDNLPFFAVFKNGQLVEGGATAKEERVLEMLEKVSA